MKDTKICDICRRQAPGRYAVQAAWAVDGQTLLNSHAWLCADCAERSRSEIVNAPIFQLLRCRETVRRIPFHARGGERICTECGALDGFEHTPGCAAERCPTCGDYLLRCQCDAVLTGDNLTRREKTAILALATHTRVILVLPDLQSYRAAKRHTVLVNHPSLRGECCISWWIDDDTPIWEAISAVAEANQIHVLLLVTPSVRDRIAPLLGPKPTFGPDDVVLIDLDAEEEGGAR